MAHFIIDIVDLLCFVALAQKWLFGFFVLVPPYCGFWNSHTTSLQWSLHFFFASPPIFLAIEVEIFVGLPESGCVPTVPLILHCFIRVWAVLTGIFKALDSFYILFLIFTAQLFLQNFWQLFSFSHWSVTSKVSAALGEMSRGHNTAMKLIFYLYTGTNYNVICPLIAN